MNAPEEIDEQDRLELFRWHGDLESEFRTMHQNARPNFQALFDPSGHDRPRGASALLRGFNRSDEFILEVVNGIYERENGTRLTLPGLRPLLRTVPAFALFLLGWAHAVRVLFSLAAMGSAMRETSIYRRQLIFTSLMYSRPTITNSTRRFG